MSKETFLIDSNSFMEPSNRYYSFDIAPGFWKQLTPHINLGRIIILDMVKAEVVNGNDELSNWMSKLNSPIMDHRENAIIKKYAEVLEFVRSNPCYQEAALHEWSESNIADAWLIATAAVHGYTLITFEKTAKPNSNSPSKNAKIPDVAMAFDVKTDNLFYMMRQLGFKLI